MTRVNIIHENTRLRLQILIYLREVDGEVTDANITEPLAAAQYELNRSKQCRCLECTKMIEAYYG